MLDAQREAILINKTLRQHGVNAGVPIDGSLSFRTPMLHIHGVRRAPGVSISAVRRLQPEIAEAIGEHRRQENVPIRISANPLAIELPAPKPRPIDWSRADWRIQPGQAIVGRHYSLYHGARQLCLHLDKQPNALIAGTPGAGKSVLLQMIIMSLAATVSPDDLQFMFCDLKRADLVQLQDLPHVRALATTNDQAAALLDNLDQEVRRRVAGRQGPRLVLVIDEQAVLSEDRQLISRQNNIMSLGRSLGVNTIVATQYPARNVIGPLSVANISVRLVGAVSDARTAAIATGRPETGAESLARPGAFLYIDGPDMIRFQSYLVPGAQIAPGIQKVREQWPTSAQRIEPEAQAETELIPEIPPSVLEIFQEYYDPEIGDLRWGGLSAIIRAMFGTRANTGGANKRRAEQVIEYLKTTTTTAFAATAPLYTRSSKE